MQNQLNKITADSTELKQLKDASKKHPGCYNVLDKSYFDLDGYITAKQFLVARKIPLDWVENKTFSKRAAQALRVGKGLTNLPTKNGNVLYSSEDIGYLEETLKGLLGLS